MIYYFYLKKLVTNLHGKTEYVIYVRNLKQSLNNGLGLKKVLRVIFNQNPRLKPYIGMIADLEESKK